MNVFTKVKWFLGILGVFLIILATNLIDKQNFLRVEESVDKIYNERLLAKELLLDVTMKFHQKELAYALKDSVYLEFQNDRVNSEIIELLGMFERTGATKEEEAILVELNENHTKLMMLESNSQVNDSLYGTDCIELFKCINLNISNLSAEQVKEGKRENHHATDAVNSAKLFTEIEIYILILLALILQVIVLYNPKKETLES
jgi:hypothetical protein